MSVTLALANGGRVGDGGGGSNREAWEEAAAMEEE